MKDAPVLPQIQRVIPCSSSSAPLIAGLSAWPGMASDITASRTGCLSFSFSFSFGFRFALPLMEAPWVELAELVDGAEPFLRSSTSSSRSSCLRRFCLPLLLLEARPGRLMISFCLGAGSRSGDLEALVDAEGIERRPERRISFGESGGPIVAAWAII